VAAAPPGGTDGPREAQDLVAGQEVAQARRADEFALRAVDDDDVVAAAHAVPVVEGHGVVPAVGDEGTAGTDRVGQLPLPDGSVRTVLLLVRFQVEADPHAVRQAVGVRG
jgi:hypothetical protein